MHFTDPGGLWALAGLLIPVVIHLLSRKEGKTIPIGSLRYLRASATARFRHIKLNEPALLLLRSLLVILFVLLLSGFLWNIDNKPGRRWLLIEKGIHTRQPVHRLIDSLSDRGFELRLLAKGFPPAGDSSGIESEEEYPALMEDPALRHIDSAIVIAHGYQRKFKGSRISLPSQVRWVSLHPDESRFTAEQIRHRGDSTWIRRGFSSADITSYETVKQPSAGGADPAEIRIHIFSSPQFSHDAKIIMAALQAVQDVTPHKLRISTAAAAAYSAPDAEWIFWLSDESFKGSRGGKSIAYRPCTGEHMPLLIRSAEATLSCGDGESTFALTRRLHEETALGEDLTLQLAMLMLPAVAVDRMDNRVIPASMQWAGPKTERMAGVDTKATEPYLILLMLLTLVAERCLAFKRLQ